MSLALLLCALPLGAQSWESVRSLKLLDRVKVLEAGGREHQGTLKLVTGNAISLETGKGAVTIEKAWVRRVQVRSRARRVRNLAIGAAVGLAVGAAIDQTLGAYFRNETGETNGDHALTYLAPVGLFGGLGGAFPAYRTVYFVK
ncbi:MAG: hypothetical protein ABSH40_03065 [Bryobacteraceae bacterium]